MEIFLGEIYVRYMQEEKKETLFELTREIVVKLSNGMTLTVPIGFVTDFASIPKVFWSAIAPIGKYNLAAIIHDYFYTHHNSTRIFADKEFLKWLNYLSPNKKIRNYVMYICIRAFGAKRWKYYGNDTNS